MSKKTKTEGAVETIKKKREPKAKVVKVMYPGLKPGPDGERTVKLKEWPSDHDPKKHDRLKRGDFENEAPFLIKRAERLEAKAKQLREEAASAASGASKAQKKMIKMAQQFNDQFAELAKELAPEELEAFKKMFEAKLAGGDAAKEGA